MLIKEIMCQKRNENLVQENDMYNKIYGYYLVFIIYSSKIFYERNKFYNYTTQQNRANFDMILIITRLREKLFLRTTSDLSLLPTRENRNSLKSHLLLFLSEKSILTIASCSAEIVNTLRTCERIGNACVNNRFVFYGYHFEY